MAVRKPVTADKRPSPVVCFAEGQNLALGKKKIFAFFASKFFPWVYCCTLKYILKFGAFLFY
jgi:hypothetical protein